MDCLYEKYRPRRLSQVRGQDKAVAVLRSMERRGGFGGRAFWIDGVSGSGKTTLAKIIALSVAGDEIGVTEYVADDLRAAVLDDIARSYGIGYLTGGRAIIVNEAHGLNQGQIRKLLDMLEPIPANLVWIFTTTRDGKGKLFDDQIDAGPLLSRCVPLALTNQGLSAAFGRLCGRIATREGLNGRPESAYIRLAQDCSNNARAMLQAIEAGKMLA